MSAKTVDNPKPNKQKLKPLSGFPEWLPEERLVELEWLDAIREIFESYGFCSIETRSVEPVDVLLKQGDTDKEIYAIRRLMEEDANSEAAVALHYDMTVPFARYVAANMNNLVFPFKRYQIQKAWRGERPQEGRFREFYQCDIDVVDHNSVPLHFDAEMPAIMYEIFQRLALGPVKISINNRKILEGYYQGLEVTDIAGAVRIVDKLDKVGERGVAALLKDELGLADNAVQACLDLALINAGDSSFVDQVRALGVSSPLLDEGLEELGFVMDSLAYLPGGTVVADLSVARGLAYYTGTVYETRLLDYPGYPAVCSGGRYDDLVGSFIKQKLPGVGISLGLTRIFAKLQKERRLDTQRKCPTDVMVAYPRGAERAVVAETARALRGRGLRVEMYHEDRKLDAQLRYASRKGIPYVWFPAVEAGMHHEVKNMTSGEQVPADITDWKAAIRPRVGRPVSRPWPQG